MSSQRNSISFLWAMAGITVLFSGIVFAEMAPGSGDENEISSWVLNFANPSAPSNTTPSIEKFNEWNIGSAFGYEEPSSTSTSSGGNNHGGRLGTANYSLQNRSSLATIARKIAAIQQKNTEQVHTSAPETEPVPLEVVSSFLVADAGHDDLITPYEESVVESPAIEKPIVVKKQPRIALPTIRSNTRYYKNTKIIVVPTEPFSVEKTHLMSWEGMDEDIQDYKLNVVKKLILTTLILVGKILFYFGIVGILLALIFREKITIYRRRKVRQLTLFSLLQ